MLVTFPGIGTPAQLVTAQAKHRKVQNPIIGEEKLFVRIISTTLSTATTAAAASINFTGK